MRQFWESGDGCPDCDRLEAEVEQLKKQIKDKDEILLRLFEGSCYGCSCLAACEEDGLAWDAYNIGCVAREDCLGAK